MCRLAHCHFLILFQSAVMQSGFGFCGHDDIQRWQRALEPIRASAGPLPRRSPIGALVKSMISGRTRDAVSLASYDRLVAAFATPARVLAAGRGKCCAASARSPMPRTRRAM
jgi:endonuclease-3